MNKHLIKTAGLTAGLVWSTIVSSVSSEPEEPAAETPNVIIILSDDQGYYDVGFTGGTEIPTPNIDRIAENGVHFTNGYVSYAVCSPSRAGLITGRYQGRFGHGRNPILAPNDSTMGLPLSEKTMADVLNQADYNSMVIGKWHLGAHEVHHPLNRGFDEFYGFLSGGHRYFPEELVLEDLSEIREQWDGYRTKMLQNHTRVEEDEYITDALSREAVNFVQRNQEGPFFLYLAYNAPHGPLQATEKYLKRFRHIKDKKRRTYAAMVSALDDGVGRLLNKLEELDIDDNTLVFFLSDNGGPEQKNGSDNGPLRAGKGSLFEGGIHVPFAVQWPGHLPKGIKYEEPVIALDIFATSVALAGVTPDPERPIDGVNLVPYIKGEKQGKPHDYLFWRKFNSKTYAVRRDSMKLKMQTGKEKLLFNLHRDLGEKHDLSGQQPEVLEKLDKKRMEWDRQMIEPAFMGLMQREAYFRKRNDDYKDKLDQ